MQIKVNQLLQVCSYYLISVNKYNLFEVHWKEDIKEENFVSPDNALLFFLWTEPRWPLVRHKFVLEPICFSEMRNKFLWRKYSGSIALVIHYYFTHKERRRQEILDKPEFDAALRVAQNAQDHD
jgi:hypothetical protein